MKKTYMTLLLALMLLLTGCKGAKAQINVPGALDRILNYEITASVNEDATVNLHYYIEWEVLNSSSEGPLEWIKVGIPNASVESIEGISPAVDSIYYYYDGGNYVRIDLDKKYYSGEVAIIEFSLVTDYMYEMNVLTEGESVYYFTPGWFNDMAVDKLTVRWSDSQAIGWSSGAYQEDGYIVWEEVDLVGRSSERSVTYTTDAFGFDMSKTYDNGDYSFTDYADIYPGYYTDYSSDYSNNVGEGIAAAVGVYIFAFITVIIVKALKGTFSYADGSGFSTEPKVTRKVTRTLIKYYPTCPGCGAVREKEQETCAYCGRSFIEKEEIVEEKEIREPDKYKDEGLYMYGNEPNTYVRVHVTHVPAPRRSCAHSSCAHSSCACAHSCACACACACAGGGRAGCSTKDFYNTGLKLKQFEKKKKASRH